MMEDPSSPPLEMGGLDILRPQIARPLLPISKNPIAVVEQIIKIRYAPDSQNRQPPLDLAHFSRSVLALLQHLQLEFGGIRDLVGYDVAIAKRPVGHDVVIPTEGDPGAGRRFVRPQWQQKRRG